MSDRDDVEPQDVPETDPVPVADPDAVAKADEDKDPDRSGADEVDGLHLDTEDV